MRPFDDGGSFRPLAGGLRQLAVKGAGVTVLANGLGLLVQMVSTVVLARLLTPADFGLVTMVTTFSLLLANFGGNGFSEAIMQWERMDHALASNIFWITVGVNSLLMAAFAGAGSLMAWFYHEPLVTRVATAMSCTIFFASTSVVHLALLKRAMRFSMVSANDIVARTISVLVSILLGLAGAGYWALVAGAIAQPLCVSVGAWGLCRWLPGPPRRAPGTGAMVKFSLNVYGRFTVNYFGRNTDNLLVGWRFSTQALGFYKKAYDLFALSVSSLVSPLSDVAVAALSRLRPDSVEYRRYLLNALGVTAFVGMGLGADLTLAGKDLIRLLLGPGWETSGRIFTFFGPGIGIMLLYATHGWIHLSIGRADRWFRWGLLEFGFTLALFLVGLPWGATGIAVAWTLSFWILTIPAFWYAGQPVGLGVSPVISSVWRYFVASVLAGGGSLAVMRMIPGLASIPGAAGAFFRLATESTVFLIQYVVAVTVLHQGYAPLSQVTRLVQGMISRREAFPSASAAAATPAHL